MPGWTIPVLLAILAPAAAWFGVEVLRSAWWTIGLYQVGLCLAAPALESAARGLRPPDHARLLGLDAAKRFPGGRTGVIAFGVLSSTAVAAFLLTVGSDWLDPDRLDETLRSWGVPPGQVPALLLVLALVNAPAEELFWRG